MLARKLKQRRERPTSLIKDKTVDERRTSLPGKHVPGIDPRTTVSEPISTIEFLRRSVSVLCY